MNSRRALAPRVIRAKAVRTGYSDSEALSMIKKIFGVLMLAIFLMTGITVLARSSTNTVPAMAAGAGAGGGHRHRRHHRRWRRHGRRGAMKTKM